MPNEIVGEDSRIGWSGTISFEQSDNWIMPWRIPIKDRALFAEQLVERAAMPAGVKLSFLSDADWVNIKCNVSDDRSPLDLFINGEFIGGCDIAMELHQKGELKEIFDKVK